MNVLLEAKYCPQHKTLIIGKRLEEFTQQITRITGFFQEPEMRRQQSMACEQLKKSMTPKVVWCIKQKRVVESLEVKICEMKKILKSLKQKRQAVDEPMKDFFKEVNGASKAKNDS